MAEPRNPFAGMTDEEIEHELADLGARIAFPATPDLARAVRDAIAEETVGANVRRFPVGKVLATAAIVVLALQPNLQHPSLLPILKSLVAGVVLVGGTLAVARFVLPPLLRWAAGLIVAGIVLFSGALYAASLGAPRFIHVLPPFGGISLIVGWMLFAISVWRIPR